MCFRQKINVYKMAEDMRGRVANLLYGIDRYNPENLNILEQYVQMQAFENTYDLEANLAVLKLYQFNPVYFRREIAAMILLKALTNLPHTDLILCKCLIDALNLGEPSISSILKLADHLEMCNFDGFWAEITTNPDLVNEITGFEDSIRKYVCHVVACTFQTISLEKFRELLGHLPGCEKLYIGERKRRLADRFTEHLRSIKNNSPDLPVAAHFNSPEHSILNAIVSAITICDDTYEKNEECLIYICGTLEPKATSAIKWATKYGWSVDNGMIFVANQDENIKTKNITETINFDSMAGILASAL